MFSSVALLALLTTSTGPVHHGRNGQLDVKPPRIEADIRIDGVLDEPAWAQAAVLTGFSRYAPTDGVAADDSTDVLVWYSANAIHFGFRAYAAPGTVNATLADRDKIYSDDYIGVFLGTFNNGREATVFASNPLGIQGDGIVVERGATSGGGFGSLTVGREPTDISPDYHFQSKGRITEYGYEVEFRIPFKSLRYQSAATQIWSVNVLRKVQSRGGYEYTWAPSLRAAQSFIGQFGRLQDLTDLQRGLVLDVNPVITARSVGAPVTADRYEYDSKAEFGGNVRWGITNNWTLNGTVNPDFAEVESDAGQIVNDPRRALFFSERRPFFLEGIEQFAAPGNLIYTRRIADPLVAAKVTGKRGGTTYAFLSAIDDKLLSFDGSERPIYNIGYVQRDLGRSSRAGLVYTDRRDGDFTNQVLGADARLVWRNIYSAQLQAAGSRTTVPGADADNGGMYTVNLRRNGRTLAVNWRLNVLEDDFQAQSGFINRPAIATTRLVQGLTAYGRDGALIQRASFDVALDGTWAYQRFVNGDDMIEKKLHFNNNVLFRGGWAAGASLLVETFGYDDDLFRNMYVERTTGSGVTYEPFTGRPRLGNIDYVVSLATPNFRKFSGSTQLVFGRDENFYEWTSANIGWIDISLNWRPTEQLRVTGTYDWQGYNRLSDGSTVAETSIPRLRVEYQLSRSIFVRVVGQYTSDFADDLRESDRSNAPLFRQVGGQFVRARGFTTADRRPKHINEFRPELLFSYLPSPGTVIYAGYGSTLRERDAFRFARGDDGLRRQRDAVFVKLSYLFRS
jgi:hypothetical protein